MIESDILFKIPLKLHWAGWDTNTWSLRNQKWELFAAQEFSPYSHEIRVRVTCESPMNDFLLTGFLDIEPRYFIERNHTIYEYLARCHLPMTQYKATDRCVIHEVTNYEWNSLISSLPFDGFMNVPKEFNFKELNLFKQNENAKEIYIPVDSVDDCFNKILQLQRPEILQMNKKIEEIKAPKILAKVYSLAA